MRENCGRCHKCISEQSKSIFFIGMILCPVCGNKRCPKATDHELECSDSNAPGQIGSVYA